MTSTANGSNKGQLVAHEPDALIRDSAASR
jgi:hypothetical protein